MDFLVSKDYGASYAMEMLQRPWLTPLMEFLTSLGSVEALRAIAVLSALFFVLIGRWRTGACLIAAGLLGMALETSVKPWVNRARPDLKWVDAQKRPKSPSFPSGAALLSMTIYGSLAVGLAAVMKRRKWATAVVVLALFLPLLIGFSRMYLGMHYMSDVLAGLLAGLGCVLLFHWVDQKWAAVAERRAAASLAATEEYELMPADFPLEPAQQAVGDQIQGSGGEQIQP